MSSALAGKRIAVTGGTGFLGRAVVRCLIQRGCDEPFVAGSDAYDLRTETGISGFLRAGRPELLIHLAAVVGGIGANRENPGTFLHDNLVMGVQLIEQARRTAVEKLVCVGTVCAYPAHAPVPFHEEDLWNGYPEPTNAPYGLAKKMLLVQLQAYRQQYGFNGIYLLPVNLYGPGDNFDPESSHVIPALIRKCVAAREQGRGTVDCWGSGRASREFLYVDDCAEAIVRATERYDGPEPINIGTGREVTIRALAKMIADKCRFTGELVWDSSMPDGQARRCLDTSRARAKLGFVAGTDLEEGIERTVSWYERQRSSGGRDV